jgi:hypothetical protein
MGKYPIRAAKTSLSVPLRISRFTRFGRKKAQKTQKNSDPQYTRRSRKKATQDPKKSAIFDLRSMPFLWFCVFFVALVPFCGSI